MRIGDVVTDPWPFMLPTAYRQQRLQEVLRAVGLSADSADAFPTSLAVASVNVLGSPRALVLSSRPWWCWTSPSSSLDVSIRSQILNLLKICKVSSDFLLLISHDLATVEPYE